MSESQTKAGNQRKFEIFWNFLKIWKFEILNSLSWSSGHAEQLLFSCLVSNVTVYTRKLQCFFLDLLLVSTLSTDIRVSRAGSQLKKSYDHTTKAFFLFWSTVRRWKKSYDLTTKAIFKFVHCTKIRKRWWS